MSQEQKIKIHLLITDYKPQIGDQVTVSCGRIFPFKEPVGVDNWFEDGRVCIVCVNKRGEKKGKFTFCFWDTPIIAVSTSPTALIGGRRSSPFQ